MKRKTILVLAVLVLPGTGYHFLTSRGRETAGFIGESRVKVPEAFFKTLRARRKDLSGYAATGFIFPNEGGSKNLASYVMTGRALEAKLGMDLFYNLDEREQENAEREMNPCQDG